MLQPQDERQQDGHLVIETIERWIRPFILLVERPDVWRDEIEIVLKSSVYAN
jgi:hypothetical protein